MTSVGLAKSSANRFKKHCRNLALISSIKEQFIAILIRQFHTELNQEGEPFVFDFRIQETTRQFYFQHSTEKDLAFVSVIDLFETFYRKQLQQVILAVALKSVVRKKKSHPGNVLSCIIRLGKKLHRKLLRLVLF